MGGSAPDNSALIAMMKQQQIQQAAMQAETERAQQQAIYNAQVQAAQQAATQGQQQAQQTLGLASQEQQAKDYAALQQAQRAMAGAGAAATGGAYDIGSAQRAKLANLGAAAGTLPMTGYNIAGTPSIARNPAATTAASQAPVGSVLGANQMMPNLQGIKFGGV